MYHALRNMADALDRVGSEFNHLEHCTTVVVSSRRTLLREFKKLNPLTFNGEIIRRQQRIG